MKRWHRIGASFGILVVVLLGACGSSDGDSGGASPSPAIEATGPAEGTGVTDPLEGTWNTPTMSKADYIRAASDSGCSQEVVDAFGGWPTDTVYTLTFQDGRVVQSETVGGGAPQVGSEGTYERPSDGSLVLTDGGDGSQLTFDMELEGDVLTLQLRHWDCNSPERVIPTFIFAGAPFTRKG